jgi:hypothetical protein
MGKIVKTISEKKKEEKMNANQKLTLDRNFTLAYLSSEV